MFFYEFLDWLKNRPQTQKISDFDRQINSDGLVYGWVGRERRRAGEEKELGFGRLKSIQFRIQHAAPRGSADLRRLRDSGPRPVLRAPYTANAVDFSQDFVRRCET